MPAEALTVALTPIQDLHGYDHPWAGGAGKNKLPLTLDNLKSLNTGGIWSGNSYTLNNVSFDVQTDDGGNVTGIKGNGTANVNTTFVISPFMDLSAFNGMLINGNTAAVDDAIIRTEMEASPWTGYSQSGGTDATIGTYAAGTNGRTFIRVFSGKTLTNQMFYPMIRNSSDSAVFSPYSNICPISGRTGTTVSTRNEDNTETASATISFGATVYGGQVDFKTGRVRVTKAIVDLGSLDWLAWSNFGFRSTDLNSLIKIVDNNTALNAICSARVVMTWMSYYNSPNMGLVSWYHDLQTDFLVCGINETYADATAFKTAVTGQKLVYELATPTELTLTPSQLQMLKGYNSVTGDGVITITAYTGSPYPVEITRKRKTKKKGGK